MIVADASWIIALRDPADPHHLRAAEVNRATANEVVLLHPVTFAECLVGPARLNVLDAVASATRAAFEVTGVDDDAPLRWARLRAATPLRLPDAIVLDTAMIHGATAILTFDQRLATTATSRGFAIPTLGQSEASSSASSHSNQ